MLKVVSDTAALTRWTMSLVFRRDTGAGGFGFSCGVFRYLSKTLLDVSGIEWRRGSVHGLSNNEDVKE